MPSLHRVELNKREVCVFTKQIFDSNECLAAVYNHPHPFADERCAPAAASSALSLT